MDQLTESLRNPATTESKCIYCHEIITLDELEPQSMWFLKRYKDEDTWDFRCFRQFHKPEDPFIYMVRKADNEHLTDTSN